MTIHLPASVLSAAPHGTPVVPIGKRGGAAEVESAATALLQTENVSLLAESQGWVQHAM